MGAGLVCGVLNGCHVRGGGSCRWDLEKMYAHASDDLT